MRKQSLARKAVRTTIISSFVLALVALFIGLSVFGSGLIEQYAYRAYEIAAHACTPVVKMADSVGLADQIMETYRSLTPEERSAEDYLDRYSYIDTTPNSDSDYDMLFRVLQGYLINVDDVYLGMFDRDTGALVYIVDPDPREEHRLRSGEWELVDARECRLFLDWDGEGLLYDIGKTKKDGWMCTAGYPIRDENGEPHLFVLADVTLRSIIPELRDYTLKIGLSLLAAAGLIAWLIVRYMNRIVADPINAITRAAMDYVEDKKVGVEKSHFSDLGIRSGDEIENLTGVMADMERELARHEAHITAITAQEERINTELDMARKIQAGILPNVFPPYPDRTEFDIYASMAPARAVGGDFYDFFLLDGDRLGLVIADVSGKGVPAALVMMIAKSLIKNGATLGNRPAEIFSSLNEAFCNNNQMEMFVTVWMGILEIGTGKLTAVNAGHEYPVLMKNGRFEIFKDVHSFVIGGMPGTRYKEYELRLEKGDKLFVYTDGVPEATSAGQELFGSERMLAALNAAAGGSPEEILAGVRGAVDAFVGDAEQFDDLTMLCLEYRSPAEMEKNSDGKRSVIRP